MNDLPEPLTPPDCDLQDFTFMPLHVARLRDSDLAAEELPEACWYAVLLWSASWHQIPAGSLPDNETVLIRLCGLGRDVKTFRKHRDGAMRGFVKCSDGRLYHPVVAEQALSAWRSKLEQRWRTECGRIKKHNQRHGTSVALPTLDEFIAADCEPVPLDKVDVSPKTNPPRPQGQGGETDDCPEGNSLQGTGRGTGTGTDSKEDAYASGENAPEAFKLELDEPEPVILLPEHVVEAWNAMATRHNLPKVAKLTEARRKKLNTRIAQHPIEDFIAAIAAIERSPFCLGDSRGGWRADFDFLLQPSSFVKLIEGSYDRGN